MCVRACGRAGGRAGGRACVRACMHVCKLVEQNVAEGSFLHEMQRVENCDFPAGLCSALWNFLLPSPHPGSRLMSVLACG